MGTTIGLAAALGGAKVIIHDISAQVLEESEKSFLKIVEKGIDRGKIDIETTRKARANALSTDDLSRLKQSSLIIEAMTESLVLKRKLFREVDSWVGESVILATNTSSLSVEELASTTRRPDRFLDMHFFNPAHIMPLVELIFLTETTAETRTRASEFVTRLGKTALECRDQPGFIVNRVARPFYGEPLRLLGENAADVKTIDLLM